jgi:hypothetical protein
LFSQGLCSRTNVMCAMISSHDFMISKLECITSFSGSPPSIRRVLPTLHEQLQGVADLCA